MQKSEDTRIDFLLKALNITQIEFAKALNVTTGAVTNWKKRELGVGVINKITDAYPNVSTIWLLKGEGPILTHEDNNDYLRTELNFMQETRPRLPTNFMEDSIQEYLTGSKRYTCDVIPIVRLLPKYDFTIILKDDCMQPKYEKGDELAFREVKYPQWGKDFLFDTPDGPMFRKLFEEGSVYRCSSYDSRRFPDILIPKDEISNIYQCIGLLRHS